MWNEYITIYNCILYGNKDYTDEQLKGNIIAQYSCVWDPNNIYTEPDSNSNFNISCDPNFAYDGDPNIVIYHLMPDSPCIDKGDPATSCEDQNDIDGETRLMGDYVDMGADEICPDCNDVYNPYDWNADGLVNMDEFVRFSRSWLTWDSYVHEPNCPDYEYYHNKNSPGYVDPNYFIGWDNKCNLVTTDTSQYAIDLADLLEFIGQYPTADHWLWVACWRKDIWNYIEQIAASNQQTMAMSSMLSVPLETFNSVEAASVTPARMIPAASIVRPMEFTAVIETDPAAEREQVLSLLESVDSLINAGGDDTEAWQEMKILLEQSLIETEDTEIETAEF